MKLIQIKLRKASKNLQSEPIDEHSERYILLVMSNGKFSLKLIKAKAG